ncbi:hypothetical protein SLEP1_g14278 [Rubroshorea leprosula]|uniref:Uncharacterized protein n=1 Tax=Rubroshorea leprosula TaxID=152421 RepID=A0AAV5IIH1_9ROSI|nr:hypothetical protein SLEP1_g14278 [Rubroshorea leprosula]
MEKGDFGWEKNQVMTGDVGKISILTTLAAAVEQMPSAAAAAATAAIAAKQMSLAATAEQMDLEIAMEMDSTVATTEETEKVR